MRKITISIFLVAMFLGLYFLTQAEDTINHERVHKLNCIYHGGKATVSYGWLYQDGMTTCITEGLSEEAMIQKDMLDVQNEIISYNIQSVLGSMFVIGFVFLALFICIWIWD